MTTDTTPREVNGAAAKSKPHTDLSAHVQALQDDVGVLRKDVSKLLSGIGSAGMERAEEGYEQGKRAIEEGASAASKKANDARSALETQIRKNPLPAIGLAVAAGAALSLLRRK